MCLYIYIYIENIKSAFSIIIIIIIMENNNNKIFKSEHSEQYEC